MTARSVVLERQGQCSGSAGPPAYAAYRFVASLHAPTPINIRLIAEHWDDLLRLAGSLKLGVVRAAGLTRTLQTNDRPTRLARALQELGRLVKSIYLLRFIDDASYRRRIRQGSDGRA